MCAQTVGIWGAGESVALAPCRILFHRGFFHFIRQSQNPYGVVPFGQGKRRSLNISIIPYAPFFVKR